MLKVKEKVVGFSMIKKVKKKKKFNMKMVGTPFGFILMIME